MVRPSPRSPEAVLVKYYVSSHEVEINDLTTGRKFLKRTRIPSASATTQHDFRIGRHVLLFSRNMKLIEYGDEATEKLLEASSEETVVVVSSKVVNELGNVVELMEESAGLQVVMMKALRTAEGCDAGKSLVNEEFVLDDSSDGFAVAIVLQGEGSIGKARRTMEEDERYDASSVYCTASAVEAARVKDLLFNRSGSNDDEGKSIQTNNKEDCTCCVIKPHAIKSRKVGGILSSISKAGYVIADLGLFHLDGSAAREFLEVYNGGAVPNLHLMVQEMSSGPVIALRVVRRSSSGEEEGNDKYRDVVSAFRADVAGPWDVEMARELHPFTLRARYGIDNVQNAVHCTDLSCDGHDECKYFFEILSAGAA